MLVDEYIFRSTVGQNDSKLNDILIYWDLSVKGVISSICDDLSRGCLKMDIVDGKGSWLCILLLGFFHSNSEFIKKKEKKRAVHFHSGVQLRLNREKPSAALFALSATSWLAGGQRSSLGSRGVSAGACVPSTVVYSFIAMCPIYLDEWSQAPANSFVTFLLLVGAIPFHFNCRTCEIKRSISTFSTPG